MFLRLAKPLHVLFVMVYVIFLCLCHSSCSTTNNDREARHGVPQGDATDSGKSLSKKNRKIPVNKVDGSKDTDPAAPIPDPTATILHRHATPNDLEPYTSQPNSTDSPLRTASVPPASPASSHCIVTLQEKTHRYGVRNFVSVTIQPRQEGMHLSNVFVTALLSNPAMTAIGSSDRKQQGGFVYDQVLTDRCLEELWLENVNCLGAQDTSFVMGKAVAFRVKIDLSTTIPPGVSYNLTVSTTYKDDHPHTTTETIALTTPTPSPRKAKKAR